MKHSKPLTRLAETPVSPLDAKIQYIVGVVDVVIAYVFQKTGGAL